MDDAGLKLLAAVETLNRELLTEIRGMREDMSRDRHVTAALSKRRAADAARKRKQRSRDCPVTESEAPAVQSADGHVTPPSLDLEKKDQEQDLKQPRPRIVTGQEPEDLKPAVAELRKHFESRFLEVSGAKYYWQGPKDVQGAKTLFSAAGKSVDVARKLIDAGFKLAGGNTFWAQNVNMAFFGAKVNALSSAPTGRNGASLHVDNEKLRLEPSGRKML